jgi:hypothetical protein
VLRPPCFKVDDLRVDLPFLGGEGLELGIVVLTSGDLIADVGDVALAFHGGDGGALVLLRLPFDARIQHQAVSDFTILTGQCYPIVSP